MPRQSMSNYSKQAEKRTAFYASLSVRPRTIEDLMIMHKVARTTVYKWLKGPNVVVVPGSWPREYALMNGVRVEEVIPYGEPKESYKPVNKDKLQEFLNNLLDPEQPPLDIRAMFRKVKNQEDISLLIKGLEDTLEAARLYRSTLEGLD